MIAFQGPILKVPYACGVVAGRNPPTTSYLVRLASEKDC
jgi:hypothetical protein